MQEPPVTQYFFSRASLAYHQAEDETLALCGFHFDASHPNRRFGDWQAVSERPMPPHALCGRCRRTITGEPEFKYDEDAATVDSTNAIATALKFTPRQIGDISLPPSLSLNSGSGVILWC